jgi:hypothetical protein
MKNYRGRKFFGVLIFLAVFAAAIAVVMLLWNALIPSIIGWSAINYWQAAGLLVLSRLLLGGFGRFGKFGGHSHFGHKRRDNFHYWHVMRDNMKGMSRDEKREYMRKHMREHHGFGEGFFDDRSTTEANNNTEE